MFTLPHLRKDRKLGVAERKGRYDLPLHMSAGTNFLLLLVALMSFLAMLALSGNFALSNITKRWTSGLENRITIEIPATDKNRKIRSAENMKALSAKVSRILESNPNIKQHETLKKSEIQALISPWLGDTLPLTNIPLPGLISAKLTINDPQQIKKLSAALSALAPNIRLDTHEDWLNDILRLAHSLKLSALLILLIIGLTTIIAIAAAIRSRMAEHKEDIELLHLMGASNDYISRQFQRHTLTITLKGSIAGLIAGALTLLLLGSITGNAENNLLPQTSLTTVQILTLLSLPAIASLVAFLTARFTVLRTLSFMP